MEFTLTAHFLKIPVFASTLKVAHEVLHTVYYSWILNGRLPFHFCYLKLFVDYF